MIKGVIFDLDDTLYDYQVANKSATEALCNFASKRLQIEPKEFSQAFIKGRKLTKEYLTDTGAIHSRTLYCQHALEILGINPFLHTLSLSNYFWEYFLTQITPFDHVKNFLEKLKEQKILVAVCTDMTSEIQFQKIVHLGLTELIDIMVTSEEVGVEKPSSKIFSVTLQKMRLLASDVIMIGDSLIKDVKGAQSVGITPYYFVPNGSSHMFSSCCRMITSYGELLDDRSIFENI